MIDVETLRASVLQGDFLEGVRRLLSAELDKDAVLGIAADNGDVAKIADWLIQETPFLEAIEPLVPVEVRRLAPASMAKRLIWNRPVLIPEGAVRSEMSLGAAIRLGHLKAVRLMVAQGWDVNAPQADGRTPLAWANTHQQTEIADLLSAHGAHLLPELRKPETQQAVAPNVSRPLASMIAQTANMIQSHLEKTSESPTAEVGAAFFLAAKSGDFATVSRLLTENKSLAAWRDRYHNSALHEAATEPVATLLLNSGVDVNARGWNGSMPLHNAASCGHLDVVRLLVERGADIHAKPAHAMTALHWAARGGHTDVAEFLATQGASLDAEDSWSHTPLVNAIREKHDDCAIRLISLGVNVHQRLRIGESWTVSEQATPLHWTAKYGRLAVARALLENGALLNAEDSEGNTALHYAAASGQTDMVVFLAEAGANLQHHNHRRNTPRYEAKEKGHFDVAALLCEREAAAGLSLTPEPPLAKIVRVHPHRPEAVTTARRGFLARWVWDDGAPRLLESLETPHSRFQGLSVSDDGTDFVVLTSENTLERHLWNDLPSVTVQKNLIESEYGLDALALSPDGRWVALAGGEEEIHLLDAATGKSVATVDGGERTGPLIFDPTGSLLASACSFQGGAHIRLDQVTQDGALVPFHDELDRSNYETANDQFVDTLVALAFSPDSRRLALFETSAIYHERHPAGWRGNLVLFSVETGKVVWSASIDGTGTGDRRSLREIGEKMGFTTEVLFLDNDRVLCGASRGTLLVYQIADGALLQTISLGKEASVRSLALDTPTTVWVVLSDGELMCLDMGDTANASQ